MKYTTIERTAISKDITVEEAVEKYMNEEFNLDEWLEGDYSRDDLEYFFDDFTEISEEEMEEIYNRILEEVHKYITSSKEKEKALLSDRKTILNWIDDVIQFYYGGPNEGELGYSLSNEEILDLILKNGNKI